MNTQHNLISVLSALNVNAYFGVTGGGIIDLVRYLPPWSHAQSDQFYFNINEYLAGFSPIGYYLATKKPAACLVTTGAAEKLAGCGASDARFMGVPALYLFPLNQKNAERSAPLQDVSVFGMNIIAQYKAEFGEDVVIIDDVTTLCDKILTVQKILVNSRPAIVFFYPEILPQCATLKLPLISQEASVVDTQGLNTFIKKLANLSSSARIILYLSEEVGFNSQHWQLIADFADKLNAAVVYSVNGSNAAIGTLQRNLGHVLLGANQSALDVWQNFNDDDILVCLGIDVGEYYLNLQKLNAPKVWLFSNKKNTYGKIADSYQHRFTGEYYQIDGDIFANLSDFLAKSKSLNFTVINNTHLVNKVTNRSVNIDNAKQTDLIAFYEKLNKLWQPNTIAFDDICTAYRDRQAILPQPNPNVQFFTASQGSAMGSAFGMAVGAASADTRKKTFVFSGDGCFRYYAGCLSETVNLGLVVFIFRNDSYGFVKNFNDIFLLDADSQTNYYHCDLNSINYQTLSTSMGWDYFLLDLDLKNFTDIMNHAYKEAKCSILVEIKIKAEQTVGYNFRYDNLLKS